MRKISATTVAAANTPQAVAARRAQDALVRSFSKAALAYIKETEGRDLEAERKNWTSFEVTTDHKPSGTVVVKQWLHDERAPRMLTKTWTIKKSLLVRK